MCNRLEKNETLEFFFPKLQTISKSSESISRNRDLNITQNEHVYAICCRPKKDDDIISGQNVDSRALHCGKF